MKKKIMSVLEIGLACIVGFFAFFGMICFVKIIAERSSDSNKSKEVSHNISYSKYNLNNDTGGLLIISGNGIVLKEVVDSFEDIEAIYVSESISGIEPNAFRDVEGLRTVVMPYAIEPPNMDVPRQTDVLYIEDNEYMDFLEPYF
ncbi:MAG: hypothetical protein HDT25_07940 [Ruminococcus sp.]|nr:hypothetical protein [Ruminococcus sp.]